LQLGDLLDDAVRLVDDLREFFVSALVEVFAELPLLALVVLLDLGELALAALSVALGRDRGVALEPLTERLQPGGNVLEFLVAPAELLLQLLLRGSRRRGIAQDPLGAHEPDLQRLLRADHGARRREAARRESPDKLHPALPADRVH